MGRRADKRLLAIAYLAATRAVVPSVALADAPPPPPSTGSDVTAARKRFAEALDDERAGHIDLALSKFRSVREVRDTAPVEYRIATCLESLGHLAEALAAYEAAVRLSQEEGAVSDVGPESRDRATALQRRVGHLTLSLSPRAPHDADIRIDGKAASTGEVMVDPGYHHVEATAPGVPPFESDVTLPEGARASMNVVLEPPSERPARAPEIANRSAEGSAVTWGGVALGVGGALAIGSAVSFVLRESDIRTANRLCPEGRCMGAVTADALGATNRARIEGPLGTALAVSAAAAVGAGIYFLVIGTRRAPSVATLPEFWPAGAGFTVRGIL